MLQVFEVIHYSFSHIKLLTSETLIHSEIILMVQQHQHPCLEEKNFKLLYDKSLHVARNKKTNMHAYVVEEDGESY